MNYLKGFDGLTLRVGTQLTLRIIMGVIPYDRVGGGPKMKQFKEAFKKYVRYIGPSWESMMEEEDRGRMEEDDRISLMMERGSVMEEDADEMDRYDGQV